MSGPRLVYVMGRGHSGSTVLDALVGNASEVVGVGELVVGMTRYDDQCSCGETIEHCPFWREVRARFESRSDASWDEAASAVRDQANVARFARTLVARGDHDDVDRLRRIEVALTGAIAEAAEARTVVDSSKEFTRALFFARFGDDVRIVHLVRSPFAVLGSLDQRLRSGSGFSFLRRRYHSPALAPLFMFVAVGGWTVGNLLGEIVALVARGRVLRIRYEDVCEAPERELARIGRFADIDTGAVGMAAAAGRELPLGHKAAGNRMRRAGSFRFEPGRRSGRPLSFPYRLMTAVFTWPLLLRYGYLSRHRNASA